MIVKKSLISRLAVVFDWTAYTSTVTEISNDDFVSRKIVIASYLANEYLSKQFLKVKVLAYLHDADCFLQELKQLLLTEGFASDKVVITKVQCLAHKIVILRSYLFGLKRNTL